MLDSDLAMLYQVETKNLNKAVKRNVNRFPEDFCFQLSEEEYSSLRFQFGTSKEIEPDKGGRRYLPYAFTEQGISMLSAVLRSEIEVRVSVQIMRAFVEMRRFLASNSLILNKINEIEINQLVFQKSTEEKFDKVFSYISEHEEVTQKIFFEGQIYDAFSLLAELISKAEKELVLIDNYVDVANFNRQYPTLEVKYKEVFHDRFLIADGAYAYHIGASIKDAGKKCFGINKMEDAKIVTEILEKLKED